MVFSYWTPTWNLALRQPQIYMFNNLFPYFTNCIRGTAVFSITCDRKELSWNASWFIDLKEGTSRSIISKTSWRSMHTTMLVKFVTWCANKLLELECTTVNQVVVFNMCGDWKLYSDNCPIWCYLWLIFYFVSELTVSNYCCDLWDCSCTIVRTKVWLLCHHYVWKSWRSVPSRSVKTPLVKYW